MTVWYAVEHVSGSHVPIIRRIIVSMRHLVYVTLCRWPSGMQEHMLLHTRRSSTQFFMYVYSYSLHVSGSHMPIIRRIIVSMRHLIYVTLCRWPSGMQEHMLLHTRRSSTHVQNRNKHIWKTVRRFGLFTRISLYLHIDCGVEEDYFVRPMCRKNVKL